MQLIDTHAHLYLENFKEDIGEIVRRCKSNKINKVLLPNIDKDSVVPLLDLYNKEKSFFSPMMGLHPTSVTKNFQENLAFILKEEHLQSVCAIGEIGLDYYWSKEFEAEQKIAFQYQIEFAKKQKLPIAIHCRDAFDDVLEILEKNHDKNLKAVLHCFTGNIEQANRLIDMGIYLGVGGVLTYKNSGLDTVLDQIDIKHMLLETDAPFLSPVPYRGKRNESSYTIFIAEKLASIKNMSIEEVAKTTSQNAKQLFNL